MSTLSTSSRMAREKGSTEGRDGVFNGKWGISKFASSTPPSSPIGELPGCLGEGGNDPMRRFAPAFFCPNDGRSLPGAFISMGALLSRSRKTRVSVCAFFRFVRVVATTYKIAHGAHPLSLLTLSETSPLHSIAISTTGSPDALQSRELNSRRLAPPVI